VTASDAMGAAFPGGVPIVSILLHPVSLQGMDRRDLGSWLSGPGSSGSDGALPPQDWPGQLLGLPEGGRRSVAGIGPRVAALLIDWLGSALIVGLLSGGRYGFGAEPSEAVVSQALTLALFAGQIAVLTWLGGASAGQRIVGIGAVPIGRDRIGLVEAVVRTLLICLVIPPLVYDRDRRGLHDRATRTIVVRTR
jgi:uncharacterized RDD family membrane protein YckC